MYYTRPWLRARFEWKLQDMWIGVFWKYYPAYSSTTYDVPYWNRFEMWICVVPCVPLHIVWQGRQRFYTQQPPAAPPPAPGTGEG